MTREYNHAKGRMVVVKRGSLGAEIRDRVLKTVVQMD